MRRRSELGWPGSPRSPSSSGSPGRCHGARSAPPKGLPAGWSGSRSARRARSGRAPDGDQAPRPRVGRRRRWRLARRQARSPPLARDPGTSPGAWEPVAAHGTEPTPPGRSRSGRSRPRVRPGRAPPPGGGTTLDERTPELPAASASSAHAGPSAESRLASRTTSTNRALGTPTPYAGRPAAGPLGFYRPAGPLSTAALNAAVRRLGAEVASEQTEVLLERQRIGAGIAHRVPEHRAGPWPRAPGGKRVGDA